MPLFGRKKQPRGQSVRRATPSPGSHPLDRRVLGWGVSSASVYPMGNRSPDHGGVAELAIESWSHPWRSAVQAACCS